MHFAGMDAMFWEMALLNMHSAFATGQTAAADAFNCYAHLASGIQQGSSDRNTTPSTGRHEDDKRIFKNRIVANHENGL
jgi:phosphate-selective porin